MADARQITLGALLAAADGRGADIPLLLADADRDTVMTAFSGLALAFAAVLDELPAPIRASMREQMNRWALQAATRTEG